MMTELYTFLMECHAGEINARTIDQALTRIVKENSYNYNKLIGILNEIRLEAEPMENTTDGECTRHGDG